MAHAMGVRATAFAASAAMLGAATIAALTMTFTLNIEDIFEPPPIPVLTEQPPEPPPPLVRPATPPLAPIANPIESPWLPPLTAPPTMTELPTLIGAADPGPPVISDPRWVQRPRDLARYYPRRAVQMNMQGQALLDCIVETTGALRCTVVSETPEGWGFGQAALRIARDYRMVPASQNGRAVEGYYRMRVPFELH